MSKKKTESSTYRLTVQLDTDRDEYIIRKLEQYGDKTHTTRRALDFYFRYFDKAEEIAMKSLEMAISRIEKGLVEETQSPIEAETKKVEETPSSADPGPSINPFKNWG